MTVYRLTYSSDLSGYDGLDIIRYYSTQELAFAQANSDIGGVTSGWEKRDWGFHRHVKNPVEWWYYQEIEEVDVLDVIQ